MHEDERPVPGADDTGRLIEWTGERCVPWTDDTAVVYEHLHRYRFAADLVQGMRVLDLGSGEGYGSAIMAARATQVVGLEIDPASVAHSRRRHRAPNLRFMEGSVLQLEAFGPEPFDAVVCFEVIEHIAEHEALLRGVRAVLRDGGLFVMSTPDRTIYSEERDYSNPFHVKELNRPELERLLGAHFPHVGLYGQSVTAGSDLEMLDTDGERGSCQRFLVARSDDDWVPRAHHRHTYLVAVASDAPLPDLASASGLHDHDLHIVSDLERQVAWARAEEERLVAEIGASQAREGELRRSLTLDIERLQAAAAVQEDANTALQDANTALQDATAALTADSDALGAEAAAQARALVAREEEVVRLLAAIRDRTGHERAQLETADRLRAQLEEAKAEASGWEQRFHFAISSRGWQAVERLRSVRDRIPLGRLAARRPVPAARSPRQGATAPTPVDGEEARGDTGTDRQLVLDRPARPRVSIVIPVHDQWEHTRRCLRSIAETVPSGLAEVIVVDDGSGQETVDGLARVEGLRVLRNDDNLGFLDSVNRGAGAACGEFLLFLNNDTEVREGWLEELLDAADSAQDVGAVGSKLIYPDGRLQEAGGIIWSDATGWNVGRGQDPQAPEFEFRREVDYCSAASLLVRRQAFDLLGGFDARFAPGYYEDADLCFALREHGLRVLYEPRSQVVHHEGASHGTDEQHGTGRHTKASQEVNRLIFAAKWAGPLADQLPPGTAAPMVAARRPGRSVLVLDTWVPSRDRDAGSLRMSWILHLLRDLGCHVTFFPFNRARVEPCTQDLQRAGIEVHHGPMQFAQLAEQRAGLYDVVILSRPETALTHLDTARRAFPRATIAYDTVDLHFVREQRRLALVGESHSAELFDCRRGELSCAGRSDLTITVTENEAQTIERYLPRSRTMVVPTIHEPRPGPSPRHSERRDLLFVGGFQHPPNVDAVVWFVRDVLPLVLDRLDVRFWVVGAGPTAEIEVLRSLEVIVTGFVPDLAPYLEGCRVFVCPVRYGAGMKGKNGEAMAAGLPLVTTAVGAEGMSLVDGWDALVADDPAAFADAVVRLYRDGALWESIARNGRRSVAERWSPQVVRERLATLVGQPVGR